MKHLHQVLVLLMDIITEEIFQRHYLTFINLISQSTAHIWAIGR